VLGAVLVAIVGLRVEVLKLGSSVGSELQQATTLESGNAALRSQVSELSGNQRIEQFAASMGMIMPGPMDTHFVKASSARNVGAAIRAIHAPASQTFLSGIASERQTDVGNTVAAAATSAVGVLGGATVGTPTSSTSTSGTPTSSTSTAGTSTAGTSTAGTSTAGTATSGTSTAGTSTAGSTNSSPTDVGSTSTAAGSVGAVSSTSGTTAPTGATTGGASLGG
jgi:hypothetical protein